MRKRRKLKQDVERENGGEREKRRREKRKGERKRKRGNIDERDEGLRENNRDRNRKEMR